MGVDSQNLIDSLRWVPQKVKFELLEEFFLPFFQVIFLL